MKLDFGFYPDPLNITQGDISISTLPNLTQTKDEITKDPNVRKGWIYPGNALTSNWGTNNQEPYAARLFSLRKTHTITHTAAVNESQIKFHIWVLSFFTGMRLASEENAFLDSTPIKPGKLVDFCVQDMSSAIDLAENFWTNNQSKPCQAVRLSAAIHALFISHNPQHLQYETFIYVYTALDACFAILKKKTGASGVTHAKRLEWMCNRLNIPVPTWASSGQSTATLVSVLRNHAIHEALFENAPLGFAIHGVGQSHNLPFEMQKLTCRIIAAILGVQDGNYLCASLGDRQKRLLQIT